MKHKNKAYKHPENSKNTNHIKEEYTSIYYAKPSRGLTLDRLQNIPKELSKTTNSSFNQIRETISGDMSRRNLEFTRETVSKLIQANRSKNKYDFIKSPTSYYAETQRSILNKEKLDFNSSYGQKFLKDAANCGKDKLSTVALHRGSPYKYACIKNKAFSKSRSPYRTEENHNLKSSSSNQDITNLLKMHGVTDNEYNRKTNDIISEMMEQTFSLNEQNNKVNERENENVNRPFIFQPTLINLKIPDIGNDFNMEIGKKIKLVKSISSLENLQERLIHTLETTLSELDFIINDSTLEERLHYFLESVNDNRMEIRLGSLIAIFIILKKYYITEDQKQFILSKTLYLLRHFELQEELFLVTCLEICSLYPNNDLLIQNIELIQFFMSDFDVPKLQMASFYCLMSIGYEGIKSLIELAGEKEGIYQHFILNNLLQTPHIQKIIIVRALLNDLYLNDSYKKHSSLAALSRMYDLLNDEEILNILYKFLDDVKMEKILLAITIRNSGPLGENILLNELITNKEIPIRVAIASAFSYRAPKYPKYLTMKLDNNDVTSIKNNTPGTFCKFVGEIECNLEDIDDDKTEKFYLEINTRDFLSSLQRMISLNYDNNNVKLMHRGSPFIVDSLNTRSIDHNNSMVIKKYSEFFELHLCDPMNKEIAKIDEEGKFIISEEIIKALSCCLRDKSAALRETAACSLGKIGLPESLNALDHLIESTRDFDLNVRSKAIWAIGRLDSGCQENAINSVLEALKTNFWKVKSSCLFALSQFGPKCAKKATGPLMKLLKESAINKQNVAETLIKLGTDGESCLLRLMNTEDDSNYKLKSSIAKAFALSDLSSSNIDFIVECLFRGAKSNSFLIKQNSIFSIKLLAERAREDINYLKRKNLIPFFYELMKDKEYSFQMDAVDYFKNLGAQGELIFIEGLTKDPSVTIRKNSAIGLSQMGLQTFRTLILGLYDDDWTVRRTVEKEILDNYKINNIIENFTKENSSPYSIMFTIKDILEKELFSNKSTSLFLRNLLKETEKIIA